MLEQEISIRPKTYQTVMMVNLNRVKTRYNKLLSTTRLVSLEPRILETYKNVSNNPLLISDLHLREALAIFIATKPSLRTSAVFDSLIDGLTHMREYDAAAILFTTVFEDHRMWLIKRAGGHLLPPVLKPDKATFNMFCRRLRLEVVNHPKIFHHTQATAQLANLLACRHIPYSDIPDLIQLLFDVRFWMTSGNHIVYISTDEPNVDCKDFIQRTIVSLIDKFPSAKTPTSLSEPKTPPLSWRTLAMLLKSCHRRLKRPDLVRPIADHMAKRFLGETKTFKDILTLFETSELRREGHQMKMLAQSAVKAPSEKKIVKESKLDFEELYQWMSEEEEKVAEMSETSMTDLGNIEEALAPKKAEKAISDPDYRLQKFSDASDNRPTSNN
ncbi:hypothetical protein C8J56DRAFT_925484 [Mycena floridula]|nr:hypothetical protein C8J56DRAFT_925484 [Mycena floridula]